MAPECEISEQAVAYKQALEAIASITGASDIGHATAVFIAQSVLDGADWKRLLKKVGRPA